MKYVSFPDKDEKFSWNSYGFRVNDSVLSEHRDSKYRVYETKSQKFQHSRLVSYFQSFRIEVFKVKSERYEIIIEKGSSVYPQFARSK